MEWVSRCDAGSRVIGYVSGTGKSMGFGDEVDSLRSGSKVGGRDLDERLELEGP